MIEVADSSKDFDEDFGAFNQSSPAESPLDPFSHLPPAQVSNSQEPSNIPEAMVLQRKTKTSLLELLKSYAGGSIPKVAIQTRPPTPLPLHTSPSESADKKRKQDKKGKKVVEEGEVIPFKELEP